MREGVRQPIVKPSDQIVIVGKNGSGKSVVAQYLDAQTPGQLVIVNVKNDPALTRWAVERFGVENVSIADGRVSDMDFKKRVIVYVAKSATDQKEYDVLYRRMLQRRNLTVHLDETFGPTTSSRVPDGLGLFLQHGRARNLRHIACTQRPVHIARQVITEASHIVLFPLRFNARDLQTMGEEMSVSPGLMEDAILRLRKSEQFGEYGHLWYEQRAHRLHLRPSVHVRGIA